MLTGRAKIVGLLLAVSLVWLAAGPADAATSQVATKVYMIRYADVDGVAKTLSGMVTKPESVCVNKESGAVVVTTSPDRLKTMDEVVAKLDRQTPQILVEVRIYEIEVNNQFELGVDWSFANNAVLANATRSIAQTTMLPGSFAGVGAGAMGRWGFVHGNTNFNFLIRALERNAGVDLLANPRLLVLDNVTAEVKIVEEVPYQKVIQTGMGGNLAATAFREAGVMLKVTPHVADKDLLRLRLQPELSAFTARDPNNLPIFDRRTADTTLLVKDGDTVVLAGLRRKTKVVTYNRAPFLGHIPCIGWIFRYKQSLDVQTEMVMFVTSKVVRQNVLHPREQKMLGETDLDDVRGLRKIHYLDLRGSIGYGPCPVGPNL